MAMVREREGERWKRDERRRERESDGRGKDREGREKETDGSRGKDRDGREKESDGGGRGKERDGREKEKEKGNREKEGDGRGKDSRDGREKEGDGRGKDSRDGREKEADVHSGVKRKADTSRDHSREKQKRLGTHEEGNGEKIEVADKIIEEKTNGTTSVQQKQKEEAEVHSGVKRKADSLNIGGVSLDVLAKAKKTLQMQKELSEKLKRLPQVRNLPSTVILSLLNP
jgi:U4/U6 small nuclear ribonucleoprotein PRP3